MTEEDAQSLRAIIDNAQAGGNIDFTIWYIILEDLPPFFSGSRTAEDTARIIQSRVERYLAERS